jgi:TolB-like protein/Tfp pilus assembly protein PilF
VRFGSFELRPGERALLRGGEPCAIGTRAFDLLLALVERRERVVSKAELLDLAWPGLVVEENNLSVQISSLRRLLGDAAITTVSGRGYQFTLPCESTDAAASSPQAVPPLRVSTRYLPRVAVLPFSTGVVADDIYFGDGLTEEIISHLAVNRRLFVIGRTSTLRYRDTTLTAPAIARELNVRYVVNGAVRLHAERLRITAEFVDSDLDRVLWAERFDGARDEVFDLQARIARRVTSAIDPCVLESEMDKPGGGPTRSFDAYDLVLRGMYCLHREGNHSFEQAGQHFSDAVQLDPHYAQAHAHLSWWYLMNIGEGRASRPSGFRQLALQHAYMAVEADPRDAWSLAIAGHAIAFLDKDFPVALDLFEQALQANPNCPMAWARSATTLAYLGRGEEAVRRVDNALELSPFDQFAFSFCTTRGLAAIVLEQPDEAVRWLDKALRLNPRYRAARRLLIGALALAGQLPRARAIAAGFLAGEPQFSVTDFGNWYPLQPPHLDRLLDALRLADLPD